MFGQFFKRLLLKVEGCHFNKEHLLSALPSIPYSTSQFNFPQVHCWQYHSPLLKPFSDSPPSITYSPNSRALTGWLSPKLYDFMSHVSISHRAKTLSPRILVHSLPCLMLCFWPRAPRHQDSPLLQTLHVYNTYCIFSRVQFSVTSLLKFSQVFPFQSHFFLFKYSNSNFSVLLWWYLWFSTLKDTYL